MIDSLDSYHRADAHSEPCQTSGNYLRDYLNIVKRFKPLISFAERSIL